MHWAPLQISQMVANSKIRSTRNPERYDQNSDSSVYKTRDKFRLPYSVEQLLYTSP